MSTDFQLMPSLVCFYLFCFFLIWEWGGKLVVQWINEREGVYPGENNIFLPTTVFYSFWAGLGGVLTPRAAVDVIVFSASTRKGKKQTWFVLVIWKLWSKVLVPKYCLNIVFASSKFGTNGLLSQHL